MPHRNRYDVSGNVEAEYVDESMSVLANLLGIRDREPLQLAEENALARAYEQLLGEVRIDTRLSNELIRHAHMTIFGQIYAWAGRWRTVTISKPGITWPPPAFLSQCMDEFERTILSKYIASNLREIDAFCRAVAEIQGEFLVVHPFREGNARAIKLVTDLLAVQTGRPLLAYDQSSAGKEAYILAASQVFRKNYAPMEQVIRVALEHAQRP
jgi:cell filamentation protein